MNSSRTLLKTLSKLIQMKREFPQTIVDKRISAWAEEVKLVCYKSRVVSLLSREVGLNFESLLQRMSDD